MTTTRRRGSAQHTVQRLLAAIVTLGIAGAIAACGPSDVAQSAEADAIQVVAEFSILADFAQAVGGHHVEVASLVPLGGDPHAYEPRPDDARQIADADLILSHGLGLAPWMDSLVANADGPVKVVADIVRDHALHDESGDLDPHLWMAPPLAAAYVDAIAAALAEVDPDRGATYERNAASYQRELEMLDDELQAGFATIPVEQRKLVTPHDGYQYFAAHFGLEVLGTLVGITTEEEPSAQRMREVVDAVRESEVPAVFIESTVPPRQIERVAQEADVRVAGPLYGDSVGEPGSDADDYLSMMRANATTVIDALGESAP